MKHYRIFLIIIIIIASSFCISLKIIKPCSCCSFAALVWNIGEFGAKKNLLTTKQLRHLS